MDNSLEQPRNFSYVIDGQLSAFAKPEENNLDFLESNKVSHIVSLTEDLPEVSSDPRFDFHHIPIKNHHTPTQEQMKQFCEFVEKWSQQGKVIIVNIKLVIGAVIRRNITTLDVLFDF